MALAIPAPLRRVASSRALPWVWLTLIGVGLAYWKVRYSLAWTFPGGIDGGFYTNLAEHVRDGDGLVTNVSLFHKGYREFPHHEAIYPVWPVVYGLVASVFPIARVAVWLPTAFYFLALLAAYLWARRLFPGALLPRWLPGFDAGHVLALLLGTQWYFFMETSRPYTEGIAFASLFFVLWRATALLERRRWRDGLELGAYLGLLFLIRSQFAIAAVALGVAGVLGFVLYRGEREAVLRFGAAAVAGYLAALAPYVAYVVAHTGRFSPMEFILFSETAAGSPLSPTGWYVKPEGLGERVDAIVEGTKLAFTWGEKGSYTRSFFALPYALPVAALFAVHLAVRGAPAEVARRAWAWLRSPANVHWVFTALFAAAGFAVLHLLEKAGAKNWYFDRRHNLSALPLFFLALAVVLRAPQWPWRILGAVVLGSTLWFAAARVSAETEQATLKPPRPSCTTLARWIRREAAKRGDLTVIYDTPQSLVWQTPGVNYHWISHRSSVKDLVTMTDELGADVIAVCTKTRKARRKTAMKREKAAFDAAFEKIAGSKRKGYLIFARRPAGTAAP